MISYHEGVSLSVKIEKSEPKNLSEIKDKNNMSICNAIKKIERRFFCTDFEVNDKLYNS